MPVGDEEKIGKPSGETKGGGGGIQMGGMPMIMEKYVPIYSNIELKKKELLQRFR